MSESSLLNKDQMHNRSRHLPEIDLQRELRHLHKEMENIQLECDRLIAEHVEVEEQVEKQLNQSKNKIVYHTPPFYPKFAIGKQKFVDNAKAPIAIQDETSSAYNTGNDSCRSTPLKNCIDDEHQKYNQINTTNSAFMKFNNNSLNSKESDYAYQSSPNMTKTKSPQGSFNSNRSTFDFDVVSSSSELLNPNTNFISQKEFNLAGTMYADPLYLQRMILFQQRLLRQAMVQQAYKLKAENDRLASQHIEFTTEKDNPAPTQIEGLRLEWKVRRKCVA